MLESSGMPPGMGTILDLYANERKEKDIYVQVEDGLNKIGAMLRGFRDFVEWGIEEPRTHRREKPTSGGVPIDKLFD